MGTAEETLEKNRHRPIFHKCDETIRGHVFSSFLALILLKELLARMKEKGSREVEWGRLKDDLRSMHGTELDLDGKRFTVRHEMKGDVGKALQAVKVEPVPAVVALDGRASGQS